LSLILTPPPTLSLESVVADLLRRGFHSVVFQPIRRLDDGSIYGFEALMRGPAGTPLAEPSRIFNNTVIDRKLLHQLDVACFFSAVRLGRLIAEPQTLFVNMHGETLLRHSDGVGEVRRLLDLLRIAPDRIVIELSEMTDRAHVRAIGRSLRPLRDAGARLALDDIGARYAWLHHMLWLEPDYLKLDRSFVRGAARSERRRDLIVAMVAFARGSGAEMIAEGIETADEYETLRHAGIILGQGYYLGLPLPIQEWFPVDAATAERTRVAGLIE